MNQRRRPQMPPRGPRKPQGGQQMPPQGKPGHYWHHYPYYHNYIWDDYYDYDWGYNDWDYDYWDWDYYGGPQQSARPQQGAPMPTPKPKNIQCLKVAPLLMANLLEHAFKEVQAESEIQDMLNNMMNISISTWGEELTMGDYETIIGTSTMTKPTPPQPKIE